MKGRVLGDNREVVARSDVRLGYDKPEQRPFRDEVREACRRLVPRPEAILRGVYAHPLPGADAQRDPVDLENVVTYNVGTGCLGHIADHGLVLERAPSLLEDDRFDSDQTHELRYEVTEDHSWQFWRPATPVFELNARIPGVGGSAPSARAFWVAGRRGQVRVHNFRPAGPLLVDVEVAGLPTGITPSMKALVDGLLAAGHSYAGSDHDALVGLANVVDRGLTEHEMGRLLAPWDAPLGPWKFVFPRAVGVQISPADDRIVGLRMMRGLTRGIRFRVYVAEPVSPEPDVTRLASPSS